MARGASDVTCIAVPAAELLVRPAAFDDVDAMYSICLRTGAAGEDANGYYTDGDLLGHIYVGPYVLLESGFGIVATSGDEVVGYALAAPDTAAFEFEAAAAWWPALQRRYPLPEGARPFEGRDDGLIALIHAPPAARRELLADYPAHLHIDLAPEAQGLGAGRRLMTELEAELVRRGVPGVHLGTAPTNVRSHGFYEHLGYRRLAAGELGTAAGEFVYVKQLTG
ncbi:MAG TPA: GNAT family N-acetyltransferase [Ilumatobacter sp.]|nr:GNAT family N-acetyltransferase [Ilumatobacter sp.]